MTRKRFGVSAALTAAAVALAGLAFAPAAAAVDPQSATITADCGLFGGGEATLTATQDGTSATITLTSAITTPLAIAEDSIQSTVTMVKAGGGTVAFTGTENPAVDAGDAVTVGPLPGTVTSGDSLEAFGGSLRMVVFGFSVTCTAEGPQSPGPFVFE